jgi:hypothetical protein
MPDDLKIFEASKSLFLKGYIHILSSLAPATSGLAQLSHTTGNIAAQVAQRASNAAQVGLQAADELVGADGDEPAESDMAGTASSEEKTSIPNGAEVTRGWYVDSIAAR